MKPKPTARAEHVARLDIGLETQLVPRKGQAKAQAKEKANLVFTEEVDIMVPELIRHRRDSSTRPRSRISEA